MTGQNVLGCPVTSFGQVIGAFQRAFSSHGVARYLA